MIEIPHKRIRAPKKSRAATSPEPAEQPPAPAAIGPETTDAFADVRLVDAATAAAVGGMGTSWWFDRVRTGLAPSPVVRGVRCSRWRAVEVVEFWRRFAETGGKSAHGGDE